MRLVNNYFNIFLIFHVHVNLDLRHSGTKKAKTIVCITKVHKKLIHFLKLLALDCSKYIQFWFKGKTFIIKTFHHLKCRPEKLLLFMPDEIFSWTNLTVFSNICPWCLFNFKALRFGGYWRVVLKRGRHLFQHKSNYSHEISKLCDFFFPNNNKQLPLRCIVLNISELLVIFIFL